MASSSLNLLLFGSIFGLSLSKGCEKGWLTYKNSCYYISQEKVTFDTALAECINMGGWLAATETESENDWLRLQLTIRKSIRVWLGAVDLMEEGKWRWIHSGEVVKMYDWNPGEPNGASKSNVLAGYESGKYKWIDEPRSHKHGFVCEKEGKRNRCPCRERRNNCFSNCC